MARLNARWGNFWRRGFAWDHFWHDAASQQHVHGPAVTAQASQSTTAAARVEYHAGGVTAQASQSTQGASRVVYHAAVGTSQASQVTTAAGRIVYHAGAATIQGSQAITAFGRVEYHAAAGSQQASQSTDAAGRVEYHAGGSSAQASQSMMALGHVVPFVGVIGALTTSQRSQSMAAFGTVTNPAAAEQPGGNVSRYIHDYAAGDFGRPLVRCNGRTVQASQITEARGRVIHAGTSSFQDIRTAIHVPNTGNHVFNPSPTPICMPNDIQTADESSDDELAELFAMAA